MKAFASLVAQIAAPPALPSVRESRSKSTRNELDRARIRYESMVARNERRRMRQQQEAV